LFSFIRFYGTRWALALMTVSLAGQMISYCFCGVGGERDGWEGEAVGRYCIRGDGLSDNCPTGLMLLFLPLFQLNVAKKKT